MGKLRRIGGVLAFAVLAFCCESAWGQGIAYFEDFESYSVPTAINDSSEWESTSQPDAGLVGWRVFNHAAFEPPLVGETTGKYLVRGWPFSEFGADYATLQLSSSVPLADLHVSFNYLLMWDEEGQIAIGADNLSWCDVTGEFGLVHSDGMDVTRLASADLTAYLQTAGIQSDLYLRFMAWNPTGSPIDHWFAIDNLSVSAIPEPG